MYLNNIKFDLTVSGITAWIILIAGIAIASFLVFLFIKYALPSVYESFTKTKNRTKEISNANTDVCNVPPEDLAAIALALHLQFSEMHDEESNLITINRVSRTYSPWSSKLYNMRNRRY